MLCGRGGCGVDKGRYRLAPQCQSLATIFCASATANQEISVRIDLKYVLGMRYRQAQVKPEARLYNHLT